MTPIHELECADIADAKLASQVEAVIAAYKEQSALVETLQQQLVEARTAIAWYHKYKMTNAKKAKSFYDQNRVHLLEVRRGKNRMKAEFKRFCAIDIL